MSKQRPPARKNKRVIRAAPASPQESTARPPQEAIAPPAVPEQRRAGTERTTVDRVHNRGLLVGAALAIIALLALAIASWGGAGQPAAAPTAGAAGQSSLFEGIDRADVTQLMRRGKEFYDAGRFDDAAAVYQEIVRLQPNNQAAQSNLGSTYFRLQRINEALAAFRKAVQIDPNDAEARQNLGAGLAALGSFDEAIAEYLQAVKLKPDLAPAHYSLGVLYQEKGNTDSAIQELKRFLELGGDQQLISDAQSRLKALGQ